MLGDLGEAHRAFVHGFDIRDGVLTAAANKSEPRGEAGDDHLVQAVEALDENERKELLLRVGRGEHIKVRRELQRLASAKPGEVANSASCRTLEELARVARDWGAKLKRRAHEDRLDEIEAKQEERRV